MANFEYDMVVVGSGPAGQKAAIQSAKLGKKTLVVEARPVVGGASLYDGTVPSKSFREAIVHLTGFEQRSIYGQAYRVKQNIQMEDLTDRTNAIIGDIEQTTRSQMIRNNIELIQGRGSFLNNHELKISNGKKEQIVSFHSSIVAVGSYPWQPPDFQFDNEVIMDSDGILHMKELPKSISIVGGGVIGCEYGSMFAALGLKVTIVEQRESILAFLDKEIVDSLVYKLREQKVQIVTNDKVVGCAKSPDGRAVTYLESGKRLVTDCLLVSAGRMGNTQNLGLEPLGIETDKRGLIKVNDVYQTAVPNIYAVGDVIGSPALASTAFEQGRRASCHAHGITDQKFNYPLPYGIYTIPEIGMVGKTEVELSSLKVPYEVGISRFSEIERGKISGDDTGILKILFHRHTLQILGVHVIGESAAELVHVGQTVMALGGGLDYLAHAVFNYPTLSQSYRTAALDGMNKVMATSGLPDEVPSKE